MSLKESNLSSIPWSFSKPFHFGAHKAAGCTKDQMCVTIATCAFPTVSTKKVISKSQCSCSEINYSLKLVRPKYTFCCLYLCQNIRVSTDTFHDESKAVLIRLSD